MKAHELLSEPTSWSKGSWAKDASGVGCIAGSRVAVSWCLMGAVYRCYADQGPKVVKGLERKVRARLLELDPSLVCEDSREGVDPNAHAIWNDAPGRTHGDVLTLLTEMDI